MIKVTIISNARTLPADIIPRDTTIKAALESKGVPCTGGTFYLDSHALNASDAEKTFADFDLGDEVYLSVVTKTNNA